MIKPCLYITPNLAFTTDKIKNPYITDLAQAWEVIGADVIRSPYVKWLRTADLLLFLSKADILMLNWPEDLYHRPLGRVQVWALKRLIEIFKLKKGKIVWTMHNRVSHRADAREEQKEFIEWIVDKCDLIVVHAEEGLSLTKYPHKTIYYPHPFRATVHQGHSEKDFKYDALIWGNLSPYKGVDVFLEFLYSKGLQDSYKLLICGNCSDKEYADKLKQYQSSCITIQIGFVSDEELTICFNQSRTVLFTHSGESVLTSGTLAESLSHMKTVIAPNRGNFKDFSGLGLVYTYEDFEEVPLLLSSCKENPKTYLLSQDVIGSTINKYTWSSYVETLRNELLSKT
ncbi:glycosyltransferase [Spirosoma radiotolerans]|uniref:Glycosyl transferase family 1 domain-containing protein n=1 Tax=Spirosoma radiotolerans TaxID=1379870 RepID=A0A0E3ZXF0_9BACT|nr:glycosyltransferase [Spirosoma radiotolerans]AKD57055.1 hypothetical protein SD10_21320 [Spirosoma radiotolerans]